MWSEMRKIYKGDEPTTGVPSSVCLLELPVVGPTTTMNFMMCSSSIRSWSH